MSTLFAPHASLAARPLGWARRRSALEILARRRADRCIGAMPVLTASFLSKISVPPFGALGLSLAVPLLCLSSALGVAFGRLVFDLQRLQAYIALLSLLAVVQVLSGDAFSLASLLLFAALHLPYVLHLSRTPDYPAVLRFFIAMAWVIAVLGIAQYLMQFALGPRLAFPIENFFPEAFKVDKFNAQGYLQYGSQVYRANGVFMLEPSFLSQFLAVAIVAEAVSTRRLAVMATLLAGMLVSYSGTGLMLLMACLPSLALARRRFDLLLGGAMLLAAVIALAAAADHPYLNVFFNRSREFSSAGSSGFARFIGGFYLFEQFLWPHPLRGLFGYGAGSLKVYQARAAMPAGGNALFKIVFEFGLVGGLAYFSFLCLCLKRSAAPVMLRVAVALTYLLSGVYIPFSHALAMGLVVWPNPKRPAPATPETHT